jgi:hypothetical protein
MGPTSRYEIFRKLPTKQATWVETAGTLEDAKKRIKELTVMFPGDYFIFDVLNLCFIVPHELPSCDVPPENLGVG